MTAITPAQCRAARALIDISAAQLSGVAVVPRLVIEDFEGVALRSVKPILPPCVTPSNGASVVYLDENLVKG